MRSIESVAIGAAEFREDMALVVLVPLETLQENVVLAAFQAQVFKAGVPASDFLDEVLVVR
jgi:hypothetical protein